MISFWISVVPPKIHALKRTAPTGHGSTSEANQRTRNPPIVVLGNSGGGDLPAPYRSRYKMSRILANWALVRCSGLCTSRSKRSASQSPWPRPDSPTVASPVGRLLPYKWIASRFGGRRGHR